MLSDLALAWRNVLRQRRRSGIAVASVAFGVCALLLAGGFIEYIYWATREATIHSELGHLQIARRGYHGAGRADPYAYLLPDALPAALSEVSQLRTVAPRLSFSGLISHGDATLSFLGDGVDPAREAAFGRFFEITAGDNLVPGEPLSVILGEGLARNLDVHTGDSVVLLVRNARGAAGAVELKVRGLFTTVAKDYDDNALRLPLVTAQRLMKTGGAHLWLVLLDDTAHTDAALQSLRARLAAEYYEVLPWHELADFYNKMRTLFARQVDGVKLIIAVIIVLSISNSMMMSVLERTGEIGTVLAMGTRRRGVLRQFVCEGLLLGLLGALLGLALGTVLAQSLSAVGIPMPPSPGTSHGYDAQILLTWRNAADAFVLAIGTTLVASLYPAWGASRRNIVDALRHNR